MREGRVDAVEVLLAAGASAETEDPSGWSARAWANLIAEPPTNANARRIAELTAVPPRPPRPSGALLPSPLLRGKAGCCWMLSVPRPWERPTSLTRDGYLVADSKIREDLLQFHFQRISRNAIDGEDDINPHFQLLPRLQLGQQLRAKTVP